MNVMGTQLGEFTILELIGKGGMASVYRARQPSMDRDVAVKIILPDAERAREFVARFDLEARTVANLSHAHILKVINYGYQEPYYYLAMELLLGGNLADRISGGPMPVNDILRVMRQICPALDYAHNKGVVHRDLKPQNILFDETGNAFITDFGIIKLMGKHSDLTEKNAVVGTPAYIAPEQWQTDIEIDQRADVYALGCVIYQMVTGRLPFEPDTLYRMMDKHLNQTPIPARNLRPGLPDGLYRAIDRAMAKRREQRFTTAGELVAFLESAFVSRETPITPFRMDSTMRGHVPETGTAPLKPPAVDTPALSSPRPRDDRTEPIAIDSAIGAVPEDRDDRTEPIMMETPPPFTPFPTRPSGAVAPQPLVKVQQPVAKPTSPGLPLLLIGGGLVVGLLVVFLLAGRGGESVVEANQTATQVAMIALSATATDTATNTPSSTPSIIPTEQDFTPTFRVAIVNPTSVPVTNTPLSATADGGPVVELIPTNTPTVTVTPSLTSTSTPTATFTASPTATVTTTPTATFTPTATPSETLVPPTATFTATPDSTGTAAAETAIALSSAEQEAIAAAQGATEVFRLESTNLAHSTDGSLVGRRAEGTPQNFTAEARFYNPFPVAQGTWDYGFQFRRGSDGTEYRLIVQGTGRWGLILRQNGQSAVVMRGDVVGLNTADDGFNQIRLIAKGPAGYLFVNGAFVARLDLSARQTNGEIVAATGFLQGAIVAGKTTRIEGFVVAEIKP